MMPRNEHNNEYLTKKYNHILDEVQRLITFAINNDEIPKAKDLLSRDENKKPANPSIIYVNQLIKVCGLLEKVRNVEGNSSRETMQIARKLGGILWRRIGNNDFIKIFFNNLAEELKLIHKSKYPNYKPKSRKSAKPIKFKYMNAHNHHEENPNLIMIENQLIQPETNEEIDSIPQPYLLSQFDFDMQLNFDDFL
jgi:hypothetical protein